MSLSLLLHLIITVYYCNMSLSLLRSTSHYHCLLRTCHYHYYYMSLSLLLHVIITVSYTCHYQLVLHVIISFYCVLLSALTYAQFHLFISNSQGVS